MVPEGRDDDDNVSMGKVSSLDCNSFDDLEQTDTVTTTTESVEDEASKLKTLSAFMNAIHNLKESSSPGSVQQRQSSNQDC